jgi:hypothetical protein
LHTVGVPGWQLPAAHASPFVHAFPSLHGAVLLVNEHAPVPGSQASLVQTLPSLHATGAPGWQEPSAHESPFVQALPSLHGAVLFVVTHAPVPGSQASSVQTLPSLHTTGVPGWQLPAAHASPVVQAFPSSHGAVLFVNTHDPLPLSHASSVQGLPSSQAVGV